MQDRRASTSGGFPSTFHCESLEEGSLSLLLINLTFINKRSFIINENAEQSAKGSHTIQSKYSGP